MEPYETTVLRRIGYALFLAVIAVYLFNIGGSGAEAPGLGNIFRILLP